MPVAAAAVLGQERVVAVAIVRFVGHSCAAGDNRLGRLGPTVRPKEALDIYLKCKHPFIWVRQMLQRSCSEGNVLL